MEEMRRFALPFCLPNELDQTLPVYPKAPPGDEEHMSPEKVQSPWECEILQKRETSI